MDAHLASPGAPQVTLDVLHTGVIWGWYVTMNFWAKSISTGVFLLGAFFMKRSPAKDFYRLVVPLLSFVFINITLLFTVLDLHQMFRFWHMFVWPHPTSAINLGAWVLTVFNGLTLAMAFLAWRKNDALYDRLIAPTWVLAFLATIYTAGLLGQANARELWHTPTEVAQMILAATLAGAATLLLLRVPTKLPLGISLEAGRATDDERTRFAWVLALSALVALTIFIAEVVFAPQKTEEAAYLVQILVSGELRTLFFSGLTLGFVVPAALAFFGLQQRSAKLFPAAAASSLVGLWLVKHAWLIAPQLIPLS
ncbi:MAG: NrfD/PsrC family molybdoenzyme membrane anchor subunit [Myxococcota bacterium]